MKDNEQLQKEVSSLEQKVLELTASPEIQQTSEWYFVDKLIRPEPNPRRIRLAVVLPALISVVSILLYVLLTQYLDEQIARNGGASTYNLEYLSQNLATAVVIALVLSILVLSWFLAPLPFGFWARLALPGNHPKTYARLGLLVGLLTLIGIIGVHMLAGGVAYIFGELAAAGLSGWMELLGFAFFGPALFFLAGGLFADALKTRAYDKSIDLGLPEQIVAKLSGSEQEPSEKKPAQRKSLFMQMVGPSLIVFLGTLMRFLGEMVKFTESFLHHLKQLANILLLTFLCCFEWLVRPRGRVCSGRSARNSG